MGLHAGCLVPCVKGSELLSGYTSGTDLSLGEAWGQQPGMGLLLCLVHSTLGVAQQLKGLWSHQLCL